MQVCNITLMSISLVITALALQHHWTRKDPTLMFFFCMHEIRTDLMPAATSDRGACLPVGDLLPKCLRTAGMHHVNSAEDCVCTALQLFANEPEIAPV